MFIYGNHEFRNSKQAMKLPIRYTATKVVGEYGEQARLQHRLHLSPDSQGKWVKWDDYIAMYRFLTKSEGTIQSQNLEYMQKRKSYLEWVNGNDFTKQNERA